MSLERQVKDNTSLINKIIAEARRLNQLVELADDIEVDDAFLIYDKSTDSTLKVPMTLVLNFMTNNFNQAAPTPTLSTVNYAIQSASFQTDPKGGWYLLNFSGGGVITLNDTPISGETVRIVLANPTNEVAVSCGIAFD